MDLHRGHDHHGDKATGDQNGLTKVQKSQRIRGLNRRFFILRHGAVVAVSLPFFGAEVFHGFKVQQAVDGLLVRIRVLFVHLFADFHPPFGDAEGERDIEPNGQHNDRHIADVKEIHQHPCDHQKLEHQRPHIEHKEPQEEFDALHAAFHNAA